MSELKIEQTESGWWQVFRTEVLGEFKDSEEASAFARELEREEFLRDARELIAEHHQSRGRESEN